MREWLVIEDSGNRMVFREHTKPPGYIPRDVAEKLIGHPIEDGRVTWFTAAQGAAMRAHPEWRNELPEWSPLGFWGV